MRGQLIMSLNNFMTYLSLYSPLLGLVTISKARHFKKTEWLIFIYILISFATDQAISYLNQIEYWTENNYKAIGLWGAIETVILGSWFYYVLHKKKYLPAIIAAVLAYYLVDLFVLEDSGFNAVGRTVQCFFLLILSFRKFYEFYIYEDDLFIEKRDLFWINVGILFYFSGAFFSFLLGPIILKTTDTWIIHNFSNFLKNVFIAIGLWRAK